MGILDACSRFCYTCVKCLYWLPVVFVLAIVLWAYYVYVYVLNLSGQFNKPYVVTALLLVISHIILFLHLSSYFRTIFQRHKPVPQLFLLSDEQLDQLDEMVDTQPFLHEIVAEMPVHQVTKTGGVRYCSHCELIKPDRCHHCSTCGNCILKMDHHCPWVNNCVGYSNYKFFFLFLTYTIVLCVWFILTGLYDLIHIWSGEFDKHIASKFNVSFCFIMVAVFALSTSGLFFFHFYLLFVNKTTIENMDPPRTERGRESNLFYLGIKRNLQAVFGRNLLLAFLPIQTSEGNGASFPIHGSLNAGYLINGNHGNHRSNEEGLVVVDKTGSESEVEIYAVDDQTQETHLLANT